MTRDTQHWPGAVGMFLDSRTPYFAGRSFAGDTPVGTWSGFAENLTAAEKAVARVVASCEHKGMCAAGYITRHDLRQLTPAETARVITGQPLSDVLALTERL